MRSFMTLSVNRADVRAEFAPYSDDDRRVVVTVGAGAMFLTVADAELLAAGVGDALSESLEQPRVGDTIAWSWMTISTSATDALDALSVRYSGGSVDKVVVGLGSGRVYLAPPDAGKLRAQLVSAVAAAGRASLAVAG